MHIQTDRIRIFPGGKTLLCAFLLAGACAFAQNTVRIDPVPVRHGFVGKLTNPYRARSVPPVNLHNSSRLDSLIRAGNLYLSAQDVVALAIENNIDIEVQRYGPLLAREVLRRAQGGGALRSVGARRGARARRASACRASASTQRRRLRQHGRQRRQFRRRHRDAVGPGDSVARSHRFRLRQFPARHHAAEQHLPHRNHRADSECHALTRRSTRRTGTSA